MPLEREIIAEEKARAKEKQDIIDEEFDAKIKANDEWNKEQQRVIKEVADAEKKAAEDAIKLDKLVKDAKVGIAKRWIKFNYSNSW